VLVIAGAAKPWSGEKKGNQSHAPNQPTLDDLAALLVRL